MEVPYHYLLVNKKLPMQHLNKFFIQIFNLIHVWWHVFIIQKFYYN